MVTKAWAGLLCGLALGACLATTTPGNLVPATVDQDPSLPSIVVRVAGHERRLHLQTFGDEALPPLFVLHGSLSDHRSLLFFSQLSDRYQVVLWDRRGMGLSERITREEYTWGAVVREIDEVVERFGRPASFIGHSFGAMFVALYMSEMPEKVDQAMLIEPAGLTGEIMEQTFRDLFELDLLDPQINQMMWQTHSLSPRGHEELDYKSLLLLSGKSTPGYFCNPDAPPDWPIWRPGGYIEVIRGSLLRKHGKFDYDFARGLTSFEAPVLLVGTECSVLGADFQRKYHEAMFGNATVVEVPSAGHRVPAEKPDELLSIARSYFRAYL